MPLPICTYLILHRLNGHINNHLSSGIWGQNQTEQVPDDDWFFALVVCRRRIAWLDWGHQLLPVWCKQKGTWSSLLFIYSSLLLVATCKRENIKRYHTVVLKQRHLLCSMHGLGFRSLWRLQLRHTVAVFDGDEMESCSYSHFRKKILNQPFYQLYHTAGQSQPI
jgi:hypothetical protein